MEQSLNSSGSVSGLLAMLQPPEGKEKATKEENNEI